MNLNKLTQLKGGAELLLKKHSPEILIFGGIAMGIGAAVMACRSTMKLEETVTQNKIDIEKTRELNKDKDSYGREVTWAYTRSGLRLVKLYSPAILMGGMSISAILCGRSVLRKRNLALTAAYSVLDEGYKRYRSRVVEELGEEADRRFRHGVYEEEVEVTETDAKGKEKKKKIKTENVNPDKLASPYARFFDVGSNRWTDDPASNLYTLRMQQNYANQLLESRGHLFLNEVYDMLDIPRTGDGAIVGWLYKGDGDGYVDFGIYDIEDETKRRFVNGLENVILLDFNVDGPIYDKI